MKKLFIAIVVGALLALPLSAMAMEKISGSDLDDVTGQAGVTIGFGSDVVAEISFSALSWGDPDGYSTSTDAGWLIIDGDIGITQTIAQGETLSIDIAYTAGGATHNGVAIPAGKAFLALGLPAMQLDINTPDTLEIGLSSVAADIGCTLGMLNLDGLEISIGTISNLYIWCQD